MRGHVAKPEAGSGVAWVLGVGPEAGLGAAVARRFAREGLTVVVSGRTQERIEGVAAQIRQQGGRAVAEVADASDEKSILAVAAKVNALGPLRAAIFNAAAAVWAPSLELTAQDFESTWRTSTLGGFLFGREVLRALVPQGRGTLIFTGATASLRGKPPFGAFAAAKAGLRSISQTFAREFGPQGIHVAHAVIDGGIDGERLRTRHPERAKQAGEHGLLNPDAIADVYWHLHTQAPSTFTQELDLRPHKESF
jgi:NAD(P)-dependent dehydrogenase (short-subunit alcohol dehydrogenase family)